MLRSVGLPAAAAEIVASYPDFALAVPDEPPDIAA